MENAFQPVHHKQLYEELVEILITKIQNGELKKGDKFPPERILSNEFHVSRSTVRMALKTLKSMGYVRSVTGGGHYVTHVTTEDIIIPFSNMIKQDKTLILDIIEVRKHMEAHMASLAAKQATQEELAKIYGTILDMQADISTGGNGIRGDNHFHLEIAKASHNKAFVIIVELLSELLDESRQATLNIPGQPNKTIEDHMHIFEAIRDKDSEFAKVNMLDHLTKAHQNLNNLMDPDAPGSTEEPV